MADEKRGYLVAYDIKDDYRRSHVAKVLQSHGERLQYSVFLLLIRPAKMLRVRASLQREMNAAEDSVVVCDLGTSDHALCALQFIGSRSYEDVAVPTVI
ncbi:CRISPR-associated endonuclease Cas2 [Bifidobacterium sp. DSM 109958]|uniref:CRISPR-associated endoribonuclease Cas2 n=1 Tax=Bifidobacterium moraviense TaxID=2675323 RepID=A0A7Y0F433_9BIFI|nr:CRISPR-associated endonuclease Cas2 [Bifidobacterium sp. DSM 109958]NMN00677.1 CRISPR-associated endonuclease Cas2 [Bifidobacterium sp. DSM 109958]